MAFLRNPVVYVPDLANGRPIVDGQVYVLEAGTIPPVNASAIDPLTEVQLSYENEAGNFVDAPQPLYTSKGGCLYGEYPEEARQYVTANNAFVFAVYDKIGRLQYSSETFASDFVESAELAASNSTVLVGGVEAQFLTLGYVTPEMFGAVGDGVADDTESLKLAHATGKSVKGKSGATYLVNKTNYIKLFDGRTYNYNFAKILVAADCEISDTTGDGFGRYTNNIFYRDSTAAMQSSLMVSNLKIHSLARKVNGIGAGDSKDVRDDHVGWFVVSGYQFSCIGEIPGGGGPNTLTDALCGSSVNIVGYKLNLENVDVYDCGHGVVGFNSKVFRARNVRTYFCGVSRDFTSWYNCASLLCRTSELIDIEGCYSYVTGGTAYFVSVGSNYASKYTTIKNCKLVGCGLASVGAGTRSYVTYQSSIEVIDIDVTVDGWDCAIGADLHSGMKISIEDLYSSVCDTVKVRGELDYLAPWEAFNNSTLEVDGSYNDNKKKGYSVGSQFGIQCYAVKDGTSNFIRNVDIDVNISNHQAGGVYVGYVDRAKIKGYYNNNGWSRQSSNAAWPTLIVSSIYALSNGDVQISAQINKQSQGVNEEKVLCTPLILRANTTARIDLSVTNNSNQLYPVRDVADTDTTTLIVDNLEFDNPVTSGGFVYLIDNSGGTYSKVRTLKSNKSLIALISGSREISPFTTTVKETSAASGIKTVTLLGAKNFDGRIVEVVANGTWAVTVAPRAGETIDGSTGSVTVAINTSKRFYSSGGLWRTL